MPAPAPTRSRLASRSARAQRATTRLALASLGVTLLVAGCGGQAPATPTTAPAPRTTTAPSPTPSPTPEPEPEPTSTLPTSRAESSWEVVEQFFDAYTYGLQTGDSTRLKAISAPECMSCTNHIADIDALGARHVAGRGGEISFPQSSGHNTKRADQFVWEVHYRQGAIDYTLSGPDESVSAPEESAVLYIELTELTSGWIISGISQTAEINS